MDRHVWITEEDVNKTIEGLDIYNVATVEELENIRQNMRNPEKYQSVMDKFLGKVTLEGLRKLYGEPIRLPSFEYKDIQTMVSLEENYILDVKRGSERILVWYICAQILAVLSEKKNVTRLYSVLRAPRGRWPLNQTNPTQGTSKTKNTEKSLEEILKERANDPWARNPVFLNACCQKMEELWEQRVYLQLGHERTIPNFVVVHFLNFDPVLVNCASCFTTKVSQTNVLPFLPVVNASPSAYGAYNAGNTHDGHYEQTMDVEHAADRSIVQTETQPTVTIPLLDSVGLRMLQDSTNAGIPPEDALETIQQYLAQFQQGGSQTVGRGLSRGFDIGNRGYNNAHGSPNYGVDTPQVYPLQTNQYSNESQLTFSSGTRKNPVPPEPDTEDEEEEEEVGGQNWPASKSLYPQNSQDEEFDAFVRSGLDYLPGADYVQDVGGNTSEDIRGKQRTKDVWADPYILNSDDDLVSTKDDDDDEEHFFE